MVEEKKYSQILSNGLMLDHYFLLCQIKKGEKVHSDKRVKGFINLLTKKGYIKDNQLTELGLSIVDNVTAPTPIKKEEVVIVEKKTEKLSLSKFIDSTDDDIWMKGIHKKCQDKLFELIGKKQVLARIDKKAYSFLPNQVDLIKVLTRVITIYKLRDFPKIEKTLLRHIESCSNSGNWFPIMQYYILKNNLSQMVTDLDHEDDQGGDAYRSNQKFI